MQRAARLAAHLVAGEDDLVKTEIRGRVGIVTLNRPGALNALNDALMAHVVAALKRMDENPDVGCIVLTGAGRAFAAGADIKEMKDKSFIEMSNKDKLKPWEAVATVRLPIIAAVNGYALGGGCELAMMCDIIVAGQSAMFGQPEIKIGTIAGIGGTQRLTRAVGKSKAMEMNLTGQPITAAEALQFGLVSKVVPDGELLDAAAKMASQIASMSRPVAIAAKEAVNAAFNTSLDQGLLFERRLFQATFALQDRREGMGAFSEKRSPAWKHQ